MSPKLWVALSTIAACITLLLEIFHYISDRGWSNLVLGVSLGVGVLFFEHRKEKK